MEKYLDVFTTIRNSDFYELENFNCFICRDGFIYDDDEAKTALLYILKDSDISSDELEKLERELEDKSYGELLEENSQELSEYVDLDILPTTLHELIDSENLGIVKIEINFATYYTLIRL